VTRQSPNDTDPMFRPPTAREHRIAGWLFIGFAVFFFLLFVVLAGWWFRWVIVGLGVYSFLHGVKHLQDARRPQQP
jgi:hypothetical protein